MQRQNLHDGKRTETSNRADTSLTAFQRECLRVIAARDGMTHGLGIKETLTERYVETVNHGRLYPNLDELVAAGYVEKGQIDKRTNSYTLTGAGKRLLADALAAFRADVDALGDDE